MSPRFTTLCASALAAVALCAAPGCKSPPKPAPPGPPAARPATEWTPLEDALARLELRLPSVPGAPAPTPPVGQDGLWATRAVLISAAGVSVDGGVVQELRCPDGAASCELPEGRSQVAWSQTLAALGDHPPALIAADRTMSARVVASLLSALRPKDGALSWLVRDGDSFGAIVMDAGPGLVLSHLDATILMPPAPREALRSRLGTAGLIPSEEPPRAPGRLVRVTTGALPVPDACGGVEAARAVRRRVSVIRGCYREALQRTPAAAGKVEMRFLVAPVGRLTDATVTSNGTGDEGIVGCIVPALAETRIAPFTGEPCEVTWELTMRPEEAVDVKPGEAAATPLASPATPAAKLALGLSAQGVTVGEGGPVLALDAGATLVGALREAAGDRVEATITPDADLPVEQVLVLAAAARAAGMARVELEVPR